MKALLLLEVAAVRPSGRRGVYATLPEATYQQAPLTVEFGEKQYVRFLRGLLEADIGIRNRLTEAKK